MADCIEYPGYRTRDGHTKLRFMGKIVSGHRLSYCASRKVTLESIKDLVVRHTCDNAGCVNPEHLVIGTQLDNIKDRQERKRQAVKVPHEALGAIRERYGAGGITQKELGLEYGVHASQISLIVNFKNRKEGGTPNL